jgi:hypothetical protein
MRRQAPVMFKGRILTSNSSANPGGHVLGEGDDAGLGHRASALNGLSYGCYWPAETRPFDEPRLNGGSRGGADGRLSRACDREGSKAPVRSAAGNRCKPSEADAEAEHPEDCSWPNWDIRERLNSTGPLSRAVYALQSLLFFVLRSSTERRNHRGARSWRGASYSECRARGGCLTA